MALRFKLDQLACDTPIGSVMFQESVFHRVFVGFQIKKRAFLDKMKILIFDRLFQKMKGGVHFSSLASTKLREGDY